ncbi:MAG TPA: DUF1802 family protein [Pirellulales bacterium]|jgi:hypothetical protein
MLTENSIAFKEWAVVCAALASGRQTIILRKGGIDEGHDGFRVKHREFWLLPTRFHQDAAQLTSDAQPLWEQIQNSPPPAGKFLIDLYAIVEAVLEVRDLASLQNLSGQHILSVETVEQRFHYRQPGLFVLTVRTYRIPTAYEVLDSPYIAGCKSWVELPSPLSTAGAKPVLNEATFAEKLKLVNERLNHTE